MQQQQSIAKLHKEELDFGDWEELKNQKTVVPLPLSI